MASRAVTLLAVLAVLAVPASLAQESTNTGQRLFPSDTSAVSDSARSYKSGSPASSAASFSDSVEYVGSGVAVLSDSSLLGDSARAYASARITADALSVNDGAAVRLPLPPMTVSESPSFQDRATATVSVPVQPSPAIIRGGSGATGVVLAAVHGVWWNACSDDPHALITAAPGDAKLSVTLERGGSIVKARLVGAAPALLDAGLWRAPIAQSDSEITITAEMAGSMDEQTFTPSSCTGSASYTPFHAPGPASLGSAAPADVAQFSGEGGPDGAEPAERTGESSPAASEPAPARSDPAPEATSERTGDIKINDGVMWEVSPAPGADLTGEPEVALTEPAVDLTGEPTVSIEPTALSAEPSAGEMQTDSLLPVVLAVGAAAAAAAVLAWRLSARRGQVRQAPVR